MDAYLLLKWVHILSSTVLFGFGTGTAYYFWSAHRTGEPAIIARVGRMVVRADWIFTGTSGIVQPASGVLLAVTVGYGLGESWLVASYGLYALAFACWAPVVGLQVRATRLAEEALRTGSPLPETYRHAMRTWFALAWPALFAFLAIFWLMVAKPVLW